MGRGEGQFTGGCQVTCWGEGGTPGGGRVNEELKRS